VGRRVIPVTRDLIFRATRPSGWNGSREMTDTRQDQQFRTAAAKRRTHLSGARLNGRRSARGSNLKCLRRIVVALAQLSIRNVPTGRPAASRGGRVHTSLHNSDRSCGRAVSNRRWLLDSGAAQRRDRQFSRPDIALDMRVTTPKYGCIYAVWRETALRLRECIHDISSTTARCASASMAPGNG
jgi:hypothetical protein